MQETSHEHPKGYRLYWVTWGWLVAITIVMLFVDFMHFPRVLLALTLVIFMLVKASMIAGNFMHLRFERLNLIVTVAVGLLVTAAVLFAFISPDGVRVLHLSSSH